MTLIDYSDAQLSGPQARDYGHSGAIRYCPYGTSYNRKFGTREEAHSYLDAGLTYDLVFEVDVNDSYAADDDYATGRQHAEQLGNVAADWGLPVRGFLAQDSWIPSGRAGESLAYFRGAVDHLGAANVGAYGFADTMDLTRGLNLGSYWGAGDLAEYQYIDGTPRRDWVRVYQRNGSRSRQAVVAVAGVTCDVNDVLATTIWTTESTGEELLMALEQWKQERIFERVLSMSQGVEGQNFDGEQFAREQSWRDQVLTQLSALAGTLDRNQAALLAAIGGEGHPTNLDTVAALLLTMLPPGTTATDLINAITEAAGGSKEGA